MSDSVRAFIDHLQHLPLVGGVVSKASGVVNIRDIAVPVAVGVISAVGSSTITTARLEERLIAFEQRNSEFRDAVTRRLEGKDAKDADLRDRLIRLEAQQPVAAADRRPR